MRIKIWGARGSLPTPMTTSELRQRLRDALERSKGVNLDDPVAIERHIDRLPPVINTVVSGNTSCLEVRAGDALFIFDMGSGLRLLGHDMMQEAFGQGAGTAHFFISHTHFDHMEGMPFFAPFFVPGNQFVLHSPYPDLEERLRGLMRPPYFPVDFDYPQSTRLFNTLDPSQSYEIEGVALRLQELKHPGRAFAYRLEHDGKVFVYASDGEYANMDQETTQVYEDFFRQADVLIFDAMYTYEDVVSSKMEWGHSTAKAGAELAWRAGVKRLVLTHHDPIATPQQLWAKVDDADHHLRYRAMRAGAQVQPVEVLLAYEGLTLEI